MKSRNFVMAVLVFAALAPTVNSQSNTNAKITAAASAAVTCPDSDELTNDPDSQTAARALAAQIVPLVKASPNSTTLNVDAFLSDFSATLASRITCKGSVDALKAPVGQAMLPSATAVAKTSQTNNQVGATSTTAGSTSVVEKTAITQLLGIAVQNGSINNSVTGNTMTLSTSAYGLLTGFGLIKDDSATYQKTGIFPLLGASATFNLTSPTSPSTSTSTTSTDALANASRRQVSQWQVKLTFRDTTTRSPRVQSLYQSQLNSSLQAEQTVVEDLSSRPMVQITFPLQNALAADIRAKSPSSQWQAVITEAKKEPDCSGTTQTPDPCANMETAILNWASKLLAPAVTSFKASIQATLANYAKEKAAAALADQTFRTQVANIQKGFNGALTFGEQFPSSNATTTSSGTTKPSPPAYLIAGLVASWQKAKKQPPNNSSADPLNGFQSWTSNFSGTIYPNPLSTLNEQTFRGVTGSTEFDWNLARSPFLGDENDRSPMTLALSGQYQRLQENKDQSGKRPDLVLGNFKLEIPIAAGISFPLSFTAANASELVKETYVKGNFGITFDLSKLAPLLSAKN